MKIDKDVLKVLNEYSADDLDDAYSAIHEPDADDILADTKMTNYDKGTFAEWFGQDLTGQTYNGDINCSFANLTSLKGAPAIVNGSFKCNDNQLTTLEGAPQKVKGSFWCSKNKLTSLEGAPQTVGGSFYCKSTRLKSLEGAPQEVGGDFNCEYNWLTSLVGAPHTVGGSFDCTYNELTSLEGAPQKVSEDFACCSCKSLTSLKGAPQEVGRNFYCYDNNNLITLEGAPQTVGGDFNCRDCKNLESVIDAPKFLGGRFICRDIKAKDILELFKRYGKAKIDAYDDWEGTQSLGVNMSVADYLGEDYSNKTYEGDLRISGRFITDLHGLPKVINGNLELFKLGITSLEGLPEIVNGNLKIYNYENQYTSAIYDFKYLPSKIAGNLVIKNVLTSTGFKDVDTTVSGNIEIRSENKQKNESKNRKNEGTYNIDADDIQADLDPDDVQFSADYYTSFAKHVTKRNSRDRLNQDLTDQTYVGDLQAFDIDNFLGAPEIIEGNLYIRGSKLGPIKSFKNAPKQITGTLTISDATIESFKGDLQSVGNLKCQYAECMSLENLPQIENNLEINCSASTLKGLPETINGDLTIVSETLKSWDYIPDKVEGNFTFDATINSSEVNLKDLPDYIGGRIRILCGHAKQNTMEENNMKIDKDVLRILNGTKKCKSESIESDYENYFKVNISQDYQILVVEYFKGLAKFESKFLIPNGFYIEYPNGFELDEETGEVSSSRSDQFDIMGEDDVDYLATALFVHPDMEEARYYNGRDEGSPLAETIRISPQENCIYFDSEKVLKDDVANYVYSTLLNVLPDFQDMDYAAAKKLVEQAKERLKDPDVDVEDDEELEDIWDNLSELSTTGDSRMLDDWIENFCNDPDSVSW